MKLLAYVWAMLAPSLWDSHSIAEFPSSAQADTQSLSVLRCAAAQIWLAEARLRRFKGAAP
ncbi:MAG TPA: hypothetical protein VHX20_15550 [Terracidiphilus sp.]|nr:hypothetical protein [Terracidiphilus sp.]